MRKYEISIVMPCKNEQRTVGECVDRAREVIKLCGVSGEVIVADNASEDDSAMIAKSHGARVVYQKKIGYGMALRKGFAKARGNFIFMADCDLTYNLNDIVVMYTMMKERGYDMIIGDRFEGGIESKAMPLSHKVGVKALSFLGRKRFYTDVRDFHCGLRGMTREAYNRLDFHTSGMEFATEMIAMASVSGLNIGQIPTGLLRCDYERASKLRTIRDGLRHLGYIVFDGRG